MLLANFLNNFEMMGGVFEPMDQFPAIQLHSNENSLLLLAELPGISEKDLEVSISDDVVTISGKKEKFSLEGENQREIRSERWSGNFLRKIELPFEVEGKQIKANLKDGVLSISMPIKEKDKPKKITIQGE